jgi:HAD superfamily hydrolase (TIGR01509 family)
MLDRRVYSTGKGTAMRPLTDIRAVLLDMDGTLVDSDAAVERAWRTWSAEYGVDGTHAVEAGHGNPAAATIRLLLPHLSETELAVAAEREHELQYDDLADVTAAPGAGRLLATLARLDLPWAVVTSADHRLAKARLTAAGIAAPLVVTVEDVRRGKPDPEGYLLAAARLGVDPRDCLVVEDSPPGLEAGRRAGAVTAALRGLPGDVRLSSLAQLAELLAP